MNGERQDLGISMHSDLVYLSCIRTLGIPFRADWPGRKFSHIAVK
jgi:hypothetical protein